MSLSINLLRYFFPWLLFLYFIQKHSLLWPPIDRFRLVMVISVLCAWFVLFWGLVHTWHTKTTIIFWCLGEVSCLLHTIDFYLFISACLLPLFSIWIFSRIEGKWSITILSCFAISRNKFKVLLLILLMNILKHYFSLHRSLLHLLLLIRKILMWRLLDMLLIRKSIITLIMLRLYIRHIQTHIKFLLRLLTLTQHRLHDSCIEVDLHNRFGTL